MPIGPTGPYAYGKLGRPVASQFGPEAIGARFKARSGPAHSHLDLYTLFVPNYKSFKNLGESKIFKFGQIYITK